MRQDIDEKMTIGILESGGALLLFIIFIANTIPLLTKTKKQSIYADEPKDNEPTQHKKYYEQYIENIAKDMQEKKKSDETKYQSTPEHKKHSMHIEAMNIDEDTKHDYNNFYSVDEHGLPTKIDRSSEKVDMQFLHKQSENTYYMIMGGAALILLIVLLMGL